MLEYWTMNLNLKKKRNYFYLDDSKKAKVDESIVDKFEKLQVNNASSCANPVADSDMEPVPDPICLPTPYDKGRKFTIVVYGWKPWDNVIGEKGVQMASPGSSEKYRKRRSKSFNTILENHNVIKNVRS